jgi:deoxyribonuclease V
VNCRIRHRWNLSPAEAIALQEKLAGRVVRVDQLGAVRHVCGIDVDFDRDGRVACAAVAVLGFPGLELRDYALARIKTSFPYIPGLLSFREAPAVLAALRRVSIKPDLLLCDGQGIAHPRRFGLASHIGLAAGIPSIGVAKTRLVGEHRAPAERRGAWAPLTKDGECIGAVLRTRSGVKPVYVSIGHRVSLETAIEYVMACTSHYRLPETTRWAHRLAGASERELARLGARVCK